MSTMKAMDAALCSLDPGCHGEFNTDFGFGTSNSSDEQEIDLSEGFVDMLLSGVKVRHSQSEEHLPSHEEHMLETAAAVLLRNIIHTLDYVPHLCVSRGGLLRCKSISSEERPSRHVWRLCILDFAIGWG